MQKHLEKQSSFSALLKVFYDSSLISLITKEYVFMLENRRKTARLF